MDTEQKRLNVGALKAFQHYINLDSTEWKISRLLERFFFTSIRDNLETKRVQSLLRKNPVKVEKVAAGLMAPDSEVIRLGSSSGIGLVQPSLDQERTVA
jgi:hypothetical protein